MKNPRKISVRPTNNPRKITLGKFRCDQRCIDYMFWGSAMKVGGVQMAMVAFVIKIWLSVPFHMSFVKQGPEENDASFSSSSFSYIFNKSVSDSRTDGRTWADRIKGHAIIQKCEEAGGRRKLLFPQRKFEFSQFL